jgi:tRNA nucleotidyltransferase (CCA-adding enzyme)
VKPVGEDRRAALREEVLLRLVPKEEERRQVRDFTELLERELSERLLEAGLRATAEVHGSTARDTWLRGDRDIDVFIVLDPEYGRDIIPKVLDIVRDYVGVGWVEAYAEHPYIQAEIDGFDVEFVPCFRIDPGERLISSTDRTPLHTKFVRENLLPEGGDEVRLLKRFMMGVGVYGAEVKVGGFSGYLCELFIVHYRSFYKILASASAWEQREVVDITGSAEPEALKKKFGEPLIVPDPVDPSRNAASAVSDTSMWTFVASARAFLKRPRETFFFPEKREADFEVVLDSLRSRGSSLLFVVVADGDVDVPDVLWGQLYKTERSISNLLAEGGFSLIRSSVWSDEASKHILLFELETAVLPELMKFKGPPVVLEEDSVRFLRAHISDESTVSGPWIEEQRWWVEKRRRHRNARFLLEHTLRGGGVGVGIPRRLSLKFARGFQVLLDDEISAHLSRDFARFMNSFLRGRPDWLE